MNSVENTAKVDIGLSLSNICFYKNKQFVVLFVTISLVHNDEDSFKKFKELWKNDFWRIVVKFL